MKNDVVENNKIIKKNNIKFKIIIIIASFLLLIFLVFLFCIFGSVKFTFSEIINSFFNNENKSLHTIVYNIRLPRNLIAVLVGASLSVSGLLLQSVMRNPLADPGITGVSSGASVVAITVLLVLPQYTQFLPIFALMGGAIACAIVYFMAWKNGLNPIRIVLSGVAVNAMIGSIISLLTLIYSDRIQSALLWLNGSLSSKTWDDLKNLSIYTLIGLIFSIFCIRPANVLSLGEKTATSLGFNVNLIRLMISIAAVFLAASATSIVGIISFVGLIVPHISRMLIGSDHKFCFPLCISLGGITVLCADTISRTIGGTIEFPVGIVMALAGGPFFLYLLRKKGASV